MNTEITSAPKKESNFFVISLELRLIIIIGNFVAIDYTNILIILIPPNKIPTMFHDF